jgi:uncharacterized protein (DUF488 family)
MVTEQIMRLFTIGFTQKSAATFFGLLQAAGVETVLDTRLHNRSQLAGFSKGDDLKFFLGSIAGIDYQYLHELAPQKEMLDHYKKLKGSWIEYEREYLGLLRHRRVEKTLTRALLENSCLLCSEAGPTYCHRRLAAEYIQQHFNDVTIVHLS